MMRMTLQYFHRLPVASVLAWAVTGFGWPSSVASAAEHCSAEIRYLGTSNAYGKDPVGIFSVRNTGDGVYKFAVPDRKGVMHYMYAEVQVEDGRGGWKARNVQLDSWRRPPGELSVRPGHVVEVAVSDAVFQGQAEAGHRYTVLFRDLLFQCSVMSEPFLVEDI